MINASICFSYRKVESWVNKEKKAEQKSALWTVSELTTYSEIDHYLYFHFPIHSSFSKCKKWLQWASLPFIQLSFMSQE